MKKIIINETYSMSRDSNGWTLYTIRQGINPKTKEPTTREVQTYYGRLEQLCSAVIDRSAGDCETLEEIIEMLHYARQGMTLAMTQPT